MKNDKGILTLNFPDFQKVITENPVVVVEFWAEWCEPCKVYEPILEEISSTFAGIVTVGKVNTGDNRSLANTYGVMNIPTILLFKNGVKTGHLPGLLPKESIFSHIRKLLN